MAPSYNTIPTAAAEDSLLTPKKSNKIKGLVAGAALAAFVLGAVAATAVTTASTQPTTNFKKNAAASGSDCGDMDTLLGDGSCDYNTPDGQAQCWCDPSSDTYADLVGCLEFYQCARWNYGWGDEPFTIRLKAGDFALGIQWKIPHYTTIQGEGPTDTWITAYDSVTVDCMSENPGEGRIGFLLGDNSVVKDLGFVAMDTERFKMHDNGLCGGFVFETPGCPTPYCTNDAKYDIKGREDQDYISYATIDNVFITGQDPNDSGDPSKKCMYNDWGGDECGGAPQGSLYIPMNRNFKKGATNNVVMTGVTQLKSLADGANVHGAAHDITIQYSTLWYTGDDNVGLWSSSNADHGLKNIRIIGNDLSQMRTNNLMSHGAEHDDPLWGSCVSVYGLTDEILIQDNICRGHFNAEEPAAHGNLVDKHGAVNGFMGHGAITFSKLFQGEFSDSARVWITGTRFAGDDYSLVASPPAFDQFDTPDFTYFSMASARDGDWKNYKPFNWDNVGGLVLNNCPMSWLDDSDPINDRDSKHYGAPDPSFITPGLDDKKGEYVDWVDDGPAGYGWYKHDSGGNLLYKDQYGNKITEWYPDAFKTKDGNWNDYDPSCIHLACDQKNIEWNGSTWYCN